MQTLTIEQPIPHLVPGAPITVALVGCGGTGSHIAQSLARIAAHTKERGDNLRLVFIDGDTVEQKNVGRQLFSPADVGRNKAQVLTARFSALFGLDIAAVPRMADKDVLYQISTQTGAHVVLVGAVDNHAARKVLHDAIAMRSRYRYWLDCGNHESSGQVVLGTVTESRLLRGAVKLGGICTELPAASLLYPELIQPPEPELEPLDCATAMQNNSQSLMVNQFMAAIAAQYLYQLVVQRRVTTYQTVIDLDSLSMRSTPITARALAESTRLSVDEIETSLAA